MITHISPRTIGRCVAAWAFRPFPDLSFDAFVVRVADHDTCSPYDVWRRDILGDLNDNNYGAGQVYELYEARRQDAIRSILRRSLLTADEQAHILTGCNMTVAELYAPEGLGWYCDECGSPLSRSDIATSCNAGLAALCATHLVPYFD